MRRISALFLVGLLIGPSNSESINWYFRTGTIPEQRILTPIQSEALTLPLRRMHRTDPFPGPLIWEDFLLAPLDPGIPFDENSEYAIGASGGFPEFHIEQLLGLADSLGVNLHGKTALALGLGHSPAELLAYAIDARLSSIIGVEIIAQHIRMIGNDLMRYRPELHGRVHVYHANASKIDRIPDASVTVLSAVGLKFLDPDTVLATVRQIVRVLEPEGLVIGFFDIDMSIWLRLQSVLQPLFEESGKLLHWSPGSFINFLFQKQAVLPVELRMPDSLSTEMLKLLDMSKMIDQPAVLEWQNSRDDTREFRKRLSRMSEAELFSEFHHLGFVTESVRKETEFRPEIFADLISFIRDPYYRVQLPNTIGTVFCSYFDQLTKRQSDSKFISNLIQSWRQCVYFTEVFKRLSAQPVPDRASPVQRAV